MHDGVAPQEGAAERAAAPTSSHATSDAVLAFIDQGRWLADWHSKRSDSFQQRASFILAFAAAVLALLPTVADRASSMSPLRRDFAVGGLLAAVAGSLVSVGFAIDALRRRKVPGGFDPAFMREQWTRAWETGQPDEAAVQVSIAETLWRHNAAKHSFVASLVNEADARGVAFRRSVWGIGVAIIGLSVVAMTYVLHAA